MTTTVPQGSRVVIDPADPLGCWRWAGDLTATGIPVVTVSAKDHLVYRLLYRVCVEDVPNGVRFVTTCGDLQCVNPWHQRRD